MVKVDNLSKIIKGKAVLSNVSVNFDYGKIYGLYGANGSGKTMLLRAIAGLIKPTSGKVLIDDKVLRKDISFPESVGIIIENMELLPYLSAVDNLKLLSNIKKIASEDDILKTLRRVGLETEDKVKKYSLGMRQRLNIAQAIFEQPDILLLDEPTNALDERSIECVHKILKEEKSRGATIIIATHNKYDLEDLCDTIFQMKAGCLEVLG